MKSLRYMIVLPVLLIVVSVAEGWRHYERAMNDMEKDLNQALERVVASSADVDGVVETLPLLQGSPMLTFGGGDTELARQLRISSLRDTACISYSLGRGQGRAGDTSSLRSARICSDTIMLARRNAEGMAVAVTVKAYANPSLATVMSHSGGTWPLASFVAGVMMLGLVLMAQRKAMKPQVLATPAAEVHTNRTLSSPAFMPVSLTLTPMQERLMTLFCASPTHTLSREDICAALWPRKDNPEDGLYTFISRMKATLASQSSLRIVNRRGREYMLVDESGADIPTPRAQGFDDAGAVLR